MMAVRQYLGVAERGQEGWWISFPAFPGVTSAAGTLGDLMQNARDALATAVEAMQADGHAVPAGIEFDPAGGDYEPSDYQDARAVIVPVEVGAEALGVGAAE